MSWLIGFVIILFIWNLLKPADHTTLSNTTKSQKQNDWLKDLTGTQEIKPTTTSRSVGKVKPSSSATLSQGREKTTTSSSVVTTKPNNSIAWTNTSSIDWTNPSKSTLGTQHSQSRHTSVYDRAQPSTLRTVEAYDDQVDGFLATMISAHVFHRKSRLVTDYELKYLNNLRSWFGSSFDILSQVSFSALLSIDTNLMDQDESNVSQKLQRMIVDFVVVNKSTENVVCIIELDDATHGREERQRRDRRLDAVCLAIKLPIFHVTNLQQRPDIMTLVGWRTGAPAGHSMISPARNTSFYDYLHTYEDDLDDTLATMLSARAFHRKQRLVTDYELKYLNNLRRWFGSDCYILPQVSFSALLSYNIDSDSKLSTADKLKVAQKIHSLVMDFVVVSKLTENVVCIIELDDASYKLNEDQQRRQHRIDALCLAMKLPVFHVIQLQQKPDIMTLVKSVGKQVKNQIADSRLNYNHTYGEQKKQWSSANWSKNKYSGTSKRTYNSAYGARQQWSGADENKSKDTGSTKYGKSNYSKAYWQKKQVSGASESKSSKSKGTSSANFGKRNYKSADWQKKPWRSVDDDKSKATSTSKYGKRTYNNAYQQGEDDDDIPF